MAQINVEGDPKLTQIQLVYTGDNTVLRSNTALACTYAITTGIVTKVDHDLANGDLVFVDNITGGTAYKARLPYWVTKIGNDTFTLHLSPDMTYTVKEVTTPGTFNLWKVVTKGEAEELFCGGFSTSPYRIAYIPDANYTGYLDRKPSRPAERNYDFGFVSELTSFGKTLSECIGTPITVDTQGSAVIKTATSITNTLFYGQPCYFTDVKTDTSLVVNKIYYITDIASDGKGFSVSVTAPTWKPAQVKVVASSTTTGLALVPITLDLTQINAHNAMLSASVESIDDPATPAADIGKPCQAKVYYPMKRPKPALTNLYWYLDDIRHKIEGFASDISLNFSKGEIATISFNCIGKFKDLPSKATCPTIVDHYKNEFPKYMLREREVYKGAFSEPLKVLGVEMKLKFPYWKWSGATWELKTPDPVLWDDYFSFVCPQVAFGLGNSNVLRGDMRETFGNTTPTVVDRSIAYALTIEEQDAEGEVNIWKLLQYEEPVTLGDENTAWKGAPFSPVPKINLLIKLGDDAGERFQLTGDLSIASVFDRGGGGVATIGLSGMAHLSYCETQDDILVPGMPQLKFS